MVTMLNPMVKMQPMRCADIACAASIEFGIFLTLTVPNAMASLSAFFCIDLLSVTNCVKPLLMRTPSAPCRLIGQTLNIMQAPWIMVLIGVYADKPLWVAFRLNTWLAKGDRLRWLATGATG